MKLQKIRGTNDWFDKKINLWQYLEKILVHLATQYNFSEIRTPTLEYSELFQRAVGDESDIVTKQMYSFQDLKSRNLTLRPENTASVVRAVVENNLLNKNFLPLKYYYLSDLYRYERPQNLRRRQFRQFGLETLGSKSFHLDAEQVLFAHTFLYNINLADQCILKINTLGTSEERKKYNYVLKNYFHDNINHLSKTSQKRVDVNPLRILDSKENFDQAIIKKAPKINQFLTTATINEFNKIRKILDTLKIPYRYDSCLVRGLDYYSKFVYEFIYQKENIAVIGGGRYDDLFLALHLKPNFACGLAIGLDRLVQILEDRNANLSFKTGLDAFIVNKYFAEKKLTPNEQLILENISQINLGILWTLRSAGFKCDGVYNQMNLKKQYEQATQLKAKKVIVLDDQLLNQQQLLIKDLVNQKQEIINVNDILNYFQNK